MRSQDSRQTHGSLGSRAIGASLVTTVLFLSPRAVPAQSSEVAALESALLRAQPLPLEDVRLLGGPLKHAQDLDAQYLLELEPDRMLALYRVRAGLEPKGEPYSGWDGPGRNLTGHIAGHYLSAVSLMWAATGDERFKERADTIVAGLRKVQERHGDGYLSALEGGRRAFGELAAGEIRSAAFDLNGEWSPWYTLHKTFAGLRDAYRLTGNATALDVEIAFATWAEGILAGLSEKQVQAMLNTEFGGMNEVMMDLYADTGDRRWLDLADKFEHRDFLLPLERHQDNLAGKHGNTQIPKLIGAADRFAYTGDARELLAASFFWDRVVQHHTFATGGHGTDEYFGPPDLLGDRVDGRTAETCNVYNMLKLTRRLFALEPDARYADFHERALFNHILGSIDPEDGRTCYMVPVGRGVTREYADMQRSFTCCVGSGMESHALHGDGIYYESGDRLWVNLYAPSTAEWKAAGAQLTMETDFPEGEHARLVLAMQAPRELTLALRKPYWVESGFAVTVNGEAVDTGREEPPTDSRRGRGARLYAWPWAASSYVEVTREWKSGDTVELALPKSLRLEPLPDDPRRVAILWGPLVLAADLGPEPPRRRRREADDGETESDPRNVPVLVTDDRPPAEWIEVSEESPIRFRTLGVGREPDATGAESDVDLVPFYRLHRRRYAAYFDLFTTEQWEARMREYAEEAERQRLLEAATVAYLEPGDVARERELGYQGSEDSTPQAILGRHGRRTRGWFAYDFPVEGAEPMVLRLTYFSGDRRGTPADFRVLVDGDLLSEQAVERSEPTRFYDVEIPIPAPMVEGKERVTLRFEAEEGSRVATLFGIRMIRGKP